MVYGYWAHIYRRKGSDMIGQEIVVKLRKVRPAARHKFQSSFNIQAERVGAFEGVQNGLRLGLNDALLFAEMADNRSVTVYLSSGRDVNEGRIGGQRNRLGVGQEPAVHIFQRHDFCDWVG